MAASPAPIFRSRGSVRFLARAGLTALVLNEVRGIVTVALTWPIWWPFLVGVFHAAMRGA